jgi:hypothetical protein
MTTASYGSVVQPQNYTAVMRIKLFFNKIRWVALVIFINYLLCSWLFLKAESAQHLTFSDARWWTSVTSFTVGYGDIFPKTEMGRDIGQYTMVSMWILFAIMLALIIDAVRVVRDTFSHEEQEEVKDDLNDTDGKTEFNAFAAVHLDEQLARCLPGYQRIPQERIDELQQHMSHNDNQYS